METKRGARQIQELEAQQQRIRELEEANERLRDAIRNPAGYRNQTAPTHCPLCGLDGNAEATRLREALEEQTGLLQEVVDMAHGSVTRAREALAPAEGEEDRDG